MGIFYFLSLYVHSLQLFSVKICGLRVFILSLVKFLKSKCLLLLLLGFKVDETLRCVVFDLASYDIVHEFLHLHFFLVPVLAIGNRPGSKSEFWVFRHRVRAVPVGYYLICDFCIRFLDEGVEKVRFLGVGNVHSRLEGVVRVFMPNFVQDIL